MRTGPFSIAIMIASAARWNAANGRSRRTCGSVIGVDGLNRCASDAISGGMAGVPTMSRILLDRIMVRFQSPLIGPASISSRLKRRASAPLAQL